MVFDKDTLQPLHELSEEGKVAYQKMLEKVERFKRNHPLRAWFGKVAKLDTRG